MTSPNEYYEAKLLTGDILQVTIARRSMMSGRISTMVMAAPLEQWNRWFRGATPIQDALTSLSPGEREFLLSGIPPDEWDAEFKEDDQ